MAKELRFPVGYRLTPKSHILIDKLTSHHTRPDKTNLVEFLLAEDAKRNKITVSDSEIKEFIEAAKRDKLIK